VFPSVSSLAYGRDTNGRRVYLRTLFLVFRSVGKRVSCRYVTPVRGSCIRIGQANSLSIRRQYRGRLAARDNNISGHTARPSDHDARQQQQQPVRKNVDTVARPLFRRARRRRSRPLYALRRYLLHVVRRNKPTTIITFEPTPG